jgi:hypothetical protein
MKRALSTAVIKLFVRNQTIFKPGYFGEWLCIAWATIQRPIAAITKLPISLSLPCTKIFGGSTMTSQLMGKLVSFVQTEFGVSDAEVITALRHEDYRAHLPTILWQYGFISIEQLEQLLIWLTQMKDY